MLLKLLLFAGSLSITYSYNRECISFRRCRANPDEAISVFNKHKGELEAALDSQKGLILKFADDLIKKFNAEILKSPVDECKNFKIEEDAKTISDLSIKWCLLRGEECKEKLNIDRSKRNAEDCDDEVGQYCLNITRMNADCKKIDHEIHVLQECNYLNLIDTLYIKRYQNCLEKFGKSLYGLDSEECDWINDLPNHHEESSEECDDTFLIKKEIVKEITSKLNITLSGSQIEDLIKILIKWNINWDSKEDIYRNINIFINLEKIREILKKMNLNLTPNQIEMILEKIRLGNINWNSSSDVIPAVEKILSQNIPEWNRRKEILIKLLDKFKVQLPPSEFLKLLITLNFNNLNWNSEKDLINVISKNINIPVDEWEIRKKWLIENLEKFKLSPEEIEIIIEKIKLANINWNDGNTLMIQIEKILAENSLEWRRRSDLVKEILSQLKINITPEGFINLLINLNLKSPNWDLKDDIVKLIAETLNIDLNIDLDWEARKKWFLEFIQKSNINLSPDQIEIILDQIKSSITNWNDQKEFFTNIMYILTSNSKEFEVRFNLTKEILKNLNLTLTDEEIANLFITLNLNGVNWGSENEIKNSIKQILKIVDVPVDQWESRNKFLLDTISKLYITITPEEKTKILEEAKKIDIDWNNQKNIILNLDKILNSNLPEWKTRRNLLIKWLNELNHQYTEEEFSNLMITLNMNNIEWNDTEILKYIGAILNIDVKKQLDWQQHQLWLIQFFDKIKIKFSDQEIQNIFNKMKSSNIDWNSENAVSSKIDEILTEFSPEWQNRRIIFRLNLANRFNIQIPDEEFSKILLHLNMQEINWESTDDVVKNMKTVLNINDDSEWDANSQWISAIIASFDLNITSEEMDVILNHLKTLKINWEDDFDVYSKIDQTLTQFSTEWKSRRESILRLLASLNINIPSSYLSSLIFNLNIGEMGQIDWKSDAAILGNIKKILKIEVHEESDLDVHIRWVQDFLLKLNLNLTSDKIKIILDAARSANIDWNSTNEILSKVDQILSENSSDWVARRTVITKILNDLKVKFQPEELTNIVLNISMNQLNWSSESEVKSYVEKYLNIEVINETDWEARERWLTDLITRFHLNLQQNDIESIFENVKEEISNWDDQNEVLTKVYEVLYENVQEWKDRSEKVQKAIKQLKIDFPDDDLPNLVITLSANDINWSLDADVLSAIKQALNVEITIEGSDLESARQKLRDSFKRLNVQIPEAQIDDVLKSLVMEGVDFNSDQEIDAALKKLFKL